MRTLVLALALLLPVAAFADDVDVNEAGKIQFEIDEQRAAVLKEYGGKKPSELSNDERREMEQKLQGAAQKVYEKHGVSDKDYSRQMARMGRGGPEAVKAAAAEAKQEKAKAEQAKKAEAEKKAEPTEIKIQKGFSEDKPVTMEGKEPETGPAIEKGTSDAKP